jgi:hypothetical protein
MPTIKTLYLADGELGVLNSTEHGVRDIYSNWIKDENTERDNDVLKRVEGICENIVALLFISVILHYHI